jgi:hypothetical protein
LFPLLTFDILPSDEIYDEMFDLSSIEDDEPLTEKFDEVGYGSQMIYGNLGSLMIFQVLIWLYMVVLAILLRYLPKKYIKIRRILERH